MVFETEVKDGILRMNCLGSIFGFTIEDSDVVMARTIEKLIEEKKVIGIVLAETREYEYDYDQTQMLVEIANAITEAVKEKKLLSIRNIALEPCTKYLPEWYGWLRDLITLQLRGDPVGAYLNLTREIRHLNTKMTSASQDYANCIKHYFENALLPLRSLLENCRLIQNAKPYLTGYHIGDRILYRKFFKPTIRPNFMYTKFMAQPPPGETIARYKIGDTDVEIFKIPGKVRYTYHVVPPEFKLDEDEYTLLDAARRILEERRPRELEITEQEKMRELFHTLSLDLLRDLSEQMGKTFEPGQMEKLASILTRYTAGLGVIEILLKDEKIQYVFINSPMGSIPIFIYHQDYEECETNLVPTRQDGDRWATRFKLISGRPLDEANPVLDTELLMPDGVARVAAINPRLSPDGLGFALRRHRFKPWTFPLFLREKFFNPLFGGLLWFIASYGRTVLVAGSRGSGKTSFLGSLMLQILPYYRMLVSEDSVTKDCEIIYKKDKVMKRDKIGNLIDSLIERYDSKQTIKGHEILDKNPEKIKVFSIDSDGKVVLADVSAFIRHKIKKEIFEIRTRTGKKIKVTGDHSLFTLGKDGSIESIKCKELKINDFLATPRLLFNSNKPIEKINLMDYIQDLKNFYFLGEPIKNIVKDNFSDIKNIAKKMNFSKSMSSRWKRTGVIPGKVFAELIKNREIKTDNILFKTNNNSKPLPLEIELDKDMLTLIGFWLADGCYDKDAVIFSVTDEFTRKIVKNIANKFGLKTRMHSDGFSLVICSSSLQFLMKKIFRLKGNAYTKRIPEWIFSLSKEQIASVLKGIYSGDGYMAEAEVGISLTSENLLKDIQTLLLSFGVIGRINRMNPKDKTHSLRISSIKTLKPFLENIGFLQEKRNEYIKKLCEKKSTHDVTDVIPLSLEFKKSILNSYKDFNKYDYINRNNNIGREKLNEIISKMKIDGGDVLEVLNGLGNSDIFWDQIADIKKEIIFDYVYDISVPINENFICENIVAHNTLELPVEHLRNLGYNIERLKSRSVITRVELELPAEEVIRTALRLGDSCLFVGEIRSLEARALFEAMRIGAMANVVAGTVHGESAYGVFDRLVNDLGVPPTSFKAVDFLVVCNKLKTQDGLRTFRRITELTEVRKHWKKDPMDEGGFVNLMEYRSTEDSLKATDTLLNGESYVLNQIASRIPGWAGRWDFVWDNIQLRAKILETIVEIANKTGKSDLLESETTVKMNQMFHEFAEKCRKEIGSIDSKRVYNEWLEWFKNYAKVV